MPSINFYLLNPYDKNGKAVKTECRLYIGVIESRNKRVKIKTPYKLKPADWNQIKQEVKITHSLHGEMNRYIIAKKQEILSAFIENRSESFDLVVTEKISSRKSGNDVQSAFEEYLKYIENIRQPGTTLRYKGLKRFLRHNIFDLYTIQFFDSLNNELIKAGYLNDYTNKIFQRLRTFFTWAKERGYHNNDVFEKNKIGPPKSTRNEIVVLTEEECKMIDDLDLDYQDDYVRNIFLLSCHTGARISDIKNLKHSEIDEDRWEFEAFKTRKQKIRVYIPFTGWCAPAKEYLKRIQERPLTLSEQKINKRLKRICKMAGINSEIKTTRMSGKNQVVRNKLKSDYMTLHTGRRTFISILMNRGLPTSIVMKLTGINNLNTLIRYLNTDTEDVIRELDRLG